MREEIGLHEMLVSAGLDPEEDIKLYRHSRSRSKAVPFPEDAEGIREIGDLEIFQSVQNGHQLGNGAVAFFMAEDDGLVRFLGIWRVKDVHDWNFDSPQAEEARQKEYLREGWYWYELEPDSRFDKFNDRLIIKWPSQPIHHHLWLAHDGNVLQVPVHELRPMPQEREH